MKNNELYHFGIKGMRWRKRKVQQTEETQENKPSFKSKVKTFAKKNAVAGAGVGVGAAAVGTAAIGGAIGSKVGSKVAVGGALTVAALGVLGGYKLGKLRAQKQQSNGQ